MTPFTVTIEAGGFELEVLGARSPYDPGQTSGPPEDCYPPEGGEVEVHKVLLVAAVADDLSPDPGATRTIEIDIADLLEDLGATDGQFSELLDNALEVLDEAAREGYLEGHEDYDE